MPPPAAGLSKDTQLLTAGVGADEDIFKAVGEPMLGIFNIAHWGHDLPNEANRKFVAAFEKECGRLPTVYASRGYDTANLIDAAVRYARGRITDKVVGTVARDLGDPHAAKCSLKW